MNGIYVLRLTPDWRVDYRRAIEFKHFYRAKTLKILKRVS